MRCGSISVNVMHNEIMAALDRIERHARSHCPQANKSDFHPRLHLRSPEGLAQILTVCFPLLVQNRDIGAYTKMAHPHVEEIFRLIRRIDLSAWRHTHLERGLEHPALDRA